MSTPFNPIQAVEQEILSNTVEEVEQIAQADPQPNAPTHEQKAKLAYEIWEANGSVIDSPLTLNFWLEAEVSMISQSGQQ